MHSVLLDYERQYRSAADSISLLVAGLSEEDLQWRAAERRWSIVECLDHLNSGWMALPRLDSKIGEARERGILGEGPYREPWLGRLYIRWVEPPVRLRVPAPKKFRPRVAPPSAEVVPRLLQLQDELIARVRASDGLDLGAIRMRSPISRRFRMSLAQWFAFLAAHERRHLWQAGRVKEGRLGMAGREPASNAELSS